VREGALSTSDAARGKLRLFASRTCRAAEGRVEPVRAAHGVTPEDAPTRVRVVQGALEGSNVRPILEMARMVEVTRTYTQIAGLLQLHSDMRRSAIEKLAEIPA